MGAITPLGHNVQEIWEALIAGKSGIVRLTVMDTSPWHCQIGGEIRGWEAERYLSQKQVRNMTFTSQLAVVASQQAIEDSGITLAEEDPTRIGVVVGTSGGSIIEETERAALQMDPDGVPRMTPVQTIRLWPNMPAYHIAEEFQVQGYSSTICTA